MSNPDNPLIHITVALELRQSRALHALKRRINAPMSEFIREGVDMVLAKYKKDEDNAPTG